MRLLAFDSCMNRCSAAVMTGGVLAAARSEAMSRGHAEALLPMIDAVCAEAGVPLAALDRLAVTVGPGSFTGVRLGVAAARGLALAAPMVTVPVSCLMAVAAAWLAGRADESVMVLQDARRGEVYRQCFAAGTGPAPTALNAPEALSLEAAAAEAAAAGSVIGSGALKLLEMGLIGDVPAHDPEVDIETLARLGAALPPAPPQGLLPLYLRGPDAKLPRATPIQRLSASLA